jgi:hypothetical protein
VGEVPEAGDVLVSQTADGDWQLRIDGVPVARRTDYGWASTFTATRAGTGELSYRTPAAYRLMAAAQVVLWVAVIGARRTLRRRERAAAAGWSAGPAAGSPPADPVVPAPVPVDAALAGFEPSEVGSQEAVPAVPEIGGPEAADPEDDGPDGAQPVTTETSEGAS